MSVNTQMLTITCNIQDEMQVEERLITASQENRLTVEEIKEMEDIARRLREATRRTTQEDEDMEGEGGYEYVNLWKLPVDVSINTQSLLL
jgi:hypothetical protein